MLLLNSASIQWSNAIQRFFTFSKLCAIGLVTVIGIINIANNSEYTQANLANSFYNSGETNGMLFFVFFFDPEVLFLDFGST